MFILLNLKGYACDAAALGEMAHEVAEATDVRIAVAPQAAQLEAVARTGVETWAQHIAAHGHGSHTGSQLGEAAATAGATGTLLNHSERRLSLADIDAGIQQAREADLETVVCANTPAQIGSVARLAPDAVAVEPPALIGSGTPVSKADPDIVRDAVDAAGAIDSSVPVLCGAGISTGEDVSMAAELGAEGVLLASGVAAADDPRAALSALVDGA